MNSKLTVEYSIFNIHLSILSRRFLARIQRHIENPKEHKDDYGFMRDSFLSERSVIFLFLTESLVFVNSFVVSASLMNIDSFLFYFK
jgi:hypothetical protein